MKWLANDIARQATFSFDATPDTGFDWENLFYGGSNLIGGVTDTSTDWLNFDLGAGNTSTIDFICLRGASLLLAHESTFTVDVQGSNDNFSSTTSLLSTTVDRGDLVGSISEDWIEFFTESAAFRYFRARVYSGVSHFHGLRKLYLGKSFDFDGTAPRYPYSLTLTNPAQSPFDQRSGSAFASSSGKSYYILDGSYHGISDALRDQFINNVVRYSADYPFWVYTANDYGHAILSDFNSMFGWCSFEITSGEQWKNNNIIRFRMREDVI